MRISKELKIGFWSIVAIVVFFLGTNYLKGINSFKKGQIYYLSTDKVDGLAVSSHITLHGLKVGMVRSMEYDKATDRIVVTLNVYDSDMQIPVDSRLTVAADLLGTSDIVIEMGQSPQCYEPGDTIEAAAGSAGLLEKADPIVSQLELLMPKIDTLVSGINVLVNESKLHESLLEVNTLTQRLSATVGELNRLLRNDVPALTGNLTALTADMDTVAIQLKEAGIRQLVGHADETIRTANELLTQMQSPDSSVGKLLETTELHDRLSSAVADMDSLISDIKKNPKRYIHIKIF